MATLERIFKLSENRTTAGTEIRAGVVTFLTMSYIIFVQPAILTRTGLSWHTVFLATCISSAIATLLMAFLANYPVALAPAMGHNVLFFMFCNDGTMTWQTGLGAVAISGSIFVVLSIWGVREKLINAVPSGLKHAIAVGIGLLIAFLGFQWAGIVIRDPAVLVKLGHLHEPPVVLAIGGLLLTAALVALRVRGAILLGIVLTALAGIPLGITSTDEVRHGAVKLPTTAPMKQLAILPVQMPAASDIPPGARVPDAASIGPMLAGAADKYYTQDSRSFLLDARTVNELLAKAGGTVDPAATPRRLSEIAGRDLLVVIPRLHAAKSDAAQEPGCTSPWALTTTTYLVTAKTVSEVDPLTRARAERIVRRQDDWSQYSTLYPAPAERIERHAKAVMLRLPDHDGIFTFDVLGACRLGLLHVIFVFFFLDLFDAIGTLIGVAQQAGLLKDGRLPRARGALLADALGTVIGAVFGTSTVSSYIESSAGVAEGGRTGLASVVTAFLLLLAIFFSPVIRMIGGAYVTNIEGNVVNLYPAVAPVLIIIGSIMLGNVMQISWTDPTEALPAFLAIMVMPLTFSITDGIAFGFISYAFLKLITGRGRQVHWLLYLFSVLFVLRYVHLSM